MKSTQRQTAAAVGFFALSLAGAPLLAQRAAAPEQRGGPPKPETPWVLVTTFQSADRKLGVEAADEVRRRLQSENSMKDLAVVTKTNIDNTLSASGYRPDSALNASDLMELAKQLRGEYVLDGTASKVGDKVRLETRILIRTGTQTVAQPLPPAEGSNAGDAAKAVERSVGEALKGMPGYQQCINALRAAKNDEAITEARAAIVAYPNSSLSRICLLNAYANKKDSPDSVISVANQIVALDKTSVLAWSNLAEAYKAKGDKDKAIEANMALYRLDPNNQPLIESIIQELVQSGAPDKALGLLDSLMAQNPSDPKFVKVKWLLQLNAKQFKNAIATGEELAKVDTAQVTVDYFNRMLGAAQSDSNQAKVLEIASKASQKFPKEATFPMLLAQSYRKAGQLQQAMEAVRRATEADPKNGNAWLIAVVTANELNQPDSAMALAQKAIAAGVTKEQIGPALLAPVGAAVKRAQDSKTRADWEAALLVATNANTVAASEGTQFYVGLSAFQVALDAINEAQRLSKSKDKADKAKACEETKVAEDQTATVAMSMNAGGKYNQEAAAQILGALAQVQEAIPQFKKALCTGK